MNDHLPEPGATARAPAGSSDRSFGLVFSAFFTIVGLLPLAAHGAPRLWSLGLALLVLAIALWRPVTLARLNRLWSKLGHLLHTLVSPLALLAIYLLAFVTTGLLCKLLRKDLLRLKFDRQARSYWIERTPPGRADQQMKKQF
ncbi:hypothetical protein [Massilia sp. DWR3-1-1]|uniref:hypothetical protein n=1 Tax=Massilia sp. DWR3-1-1 TaxID=2804559 RepID=UPI003CF0E3F8